MTSGKHIKRFINTIKEKSSASEITMIWEYSVNSHPNIRFLF